MLWGRLARQVLAAHPPRGREEPAAVRIADENGLTVLALWPTGQQGGGTNYVARRPKADASLLIGGDEKSPHVWRFFITTNARSGLAQQVYPIDKRSINARRRRHLADSATLACIVRGCSRQTIVGVRASVGEDPRQDDREQAWDLAMGEFNRDEYSFEPLLSEIVGLQPQLCSAAAGTRRCGFTINGCIVEIADLALDEAPLRTVAVEMEDVAKVVATVWPLHLEGFENINYVKALKRSKDFVDA